MVIHQIINDFSQQTGGAERLSRRIHLNLQKAGQPSKLVGLVSENNDKQRSRAINLDTTYENLEKSDQTSESSNLTHTKQLGLSSPYSLNALWKVFNYIRTEVHDNDVVHAHLSPTIYYCALARQLRLKRFHLLVTEHNSHNNRRIMVWSLT